MKMFFVQEAVYFKFKGDYYSPRIKYESYWSRYLNHFSVIVVVARVQKLIKVPENYHKVNGDNVEFEELPYYNGIIGYYKNKDNIKKILYKNLNIDCAYVLRIPGPIGSLAARILTNNKVNYAVEVVGDPYEVVQHLKIPKTLKFLLKNLSLIQMKKHVKNSIAALYVTEYTLQQRYPVKSGTLSSSASNVILRHSDIVKVEDKINRATNISSRLVDFSKPKIKIGVLGMLYPIKSPLEILYSINQLLIEDFNIELYFAGDGPLINDVELKASKFGISDSVICLGNIASGKEVFGFLDSLDLFIQFSKSEGIPRAILEAMARGCPVISSDVGGVPEFISSHFLVQSGNVKELRDKIKGLLSDQESYNKCIHQNINIAHKYSLTILDKKRSNHYSQVYKLFQNKKNHGSSGILLQPS